MKNLKLWFAALFGLTFITFSGGTALAQFDIFEQPCKNNSSATVCEDANKSQSKSNNSLYGKNGILTKIAKLISIIIGLAAVIVMIMAGIQYMTSTGDPAKVNNAKNTIVYAIIGLVLAVFAQIIIRFVIEKL